MRPLSVARKLLPGALFLLLAVFSPLPRCLAVVIVEIYDDDDGEGFLDQTALTQAEKTSLAARGNNADTWGEARKNSFEHAASILENTLADTNTIGISAKFAIFPGQENPDDPDKCGEMTQGIFTVAIAGARGHGYPGDRLAEGDTDNPGLGTGYPYALFEAISGKNLNEEKADISIIFSKCVPFYYGLTEPVPANQIDFVQLSLHETMHGLGFSDDINEDGSFPLKVIEVTQTRNGEVVDRRRATIRSRTIYDEQLYSETDDDLLIDLTNSQRAAAIISGTGLLWEGTDGGRNRCSYGKRMAELKSGSAKSRDGKPRLHAPSTYESGGSVIHTHANAEDIMEAFVPAPRNMDLTLGMLKDMGWSVSAGGFPSDCEPAGIEDNDPVQPPPPAVTVSFGSSSYSVTEGEAVVVGVTLSADPERTVTVPITIDRATTAAAEDYSLRPTSVTFASGETSKDIALTAADDGADDDGEVVVLAFGTLPQRVSGGELPSTTVTIADPDPPVDAAAGSGSGCSVGAGAGHGTKSAAARLFAAIAVLLPVFFRKSRLTD